MKKFIIAVTFLLCALLHTTVFAQTAPIEAVTVNTENHTLTIEGEIPTPSKRVTMEVLKQDKDWSDIDDATITFGESFFGIFEYIDQWDASVERSYEITITGYERDKDPDLRVRYGTTDRDVYYWSPQKLIDINSAGTIAELKEKIAAAPIKDSIDEVAALLDGDTAKEDYFYNELLDYRNSLSDGKFSNLNAIVVAAEECVRITMLHHTTTTELESLIALCEDYGLTDSNAYDLYNGTDDFDEGELTTEQKTALLEGIVAKKTTYTDVAGFVKDFLDNVVLYSCSNNASKYSVRTILSTADIMQAMDLGEYNNLSADNKLSVANATNQSPRYETISDLANDVKRKAGELSSPGGGGGGGGIVTKPDKAGDTVASVDASKPPVTDRPTENKTVFNDLGTVLWAEEAIYSLNAKGIVAGRGDGVFDPTSSVSREEFATMFVLALDCYNPDAVSEFDDVKADAWYYSYVASAQKVGLIKGVSDGLFGAGQPMTREAMAVLLAKADLGEYAPASDNCGFADDSRVSDYARGSVQYVREKGIMSGKGDGMFAPQDTVTRAEAAKAIFEMLKRKGA